MELFSERYGLEKPQKAIIRNSMPDEVENSLCNLFDKWANDKHIVVPFKKLEQIVWTRYFNRRQKDMFTIYNQQKEVIVPYIQDVNIAWNKKLDLIEYVLRFVQKAAEVTKDEKKATVKKFSANLHLYINTEFERLHYGYRVIKGCITPLTSAQEMQAIENAIAKNEDSIQIHLNQALRHFSNRDNPDYSNSIKESISAVEVMCREVTGTETLGKALKALEKNGVKIHPILQVGLQKLYDYTNQPEVGVRHGLMDADSDYSPSYDEAYFMLVSCSAFINYLHEKIAVRQVKK